MAIRFLRTVAETLAGLCGSVVPFIGDLRRAHAAEGGGFTETPATEMSTLVPECYSLYVSKMPLLQTHLMVKFLQKL